MEENVEYIEREDEFDIQPIEEIHKRRLDQEDEEVDVLTIESVKMASEFEVGDFRMPVLLDIEASDSEDEIVAIGAGQFRRKSPGTGREWMNDEDGGSSEERRVNGAAAAQNGAKRRRAGWTIVPWCSRRKKILQEPQPSQAETQPPRSIVGYSSFITCTSAQARCYRRRPRIGSWDINVQISQIMPGIFPIGTTQGLAI